jgi:N-acetylglucosaminyl-diphospho-decaprenol L-rhamnosyltransferase
VRRRRNALSAAAIGVIVVSFNSSALARRAVESAAADLGDREWQAIVVDNASTDRAAETLAGLPRTTVVVNTVNAGFGAAVNQAVRLLDAPLLWILNPDCVVHPGAVDALLVTLEAHPECAIAAPQLLNADGSTQASARGNPTAWTGLFGRNTLLTKFFPSAAMARRNLPARDLVSAGVDSAPVDWVMGAAMLIRRDMFEAAGGFDPAYFLYWEDADLCRRLWRRGLSTRYVPGARVTHAGGASARTESALATRAFHRSAYRYYATYVVPSPWHPMRWLAWGALTTRAWWRVARGR